MPTRRRSIPPDSIHHIVNRGNDRKTIFRQPVDYGSFLALLREARERYPIELYGYSLMPNHFHLVLKAASLDAIAAYMHFVQRAHACDLRACDKTRGHGHVFQRRYWNKQVKGWGYLLTVIKYVEARAGLVTLPQDWEWNSLWERVTGDRDLLHPVPNGLPDDWATIVRMPIAEIDIDRIRRPPRKGLRMPDDLRIT